MLLLQQERYTTQSLNAEQIAKKSLEIAADLCIYTNDNIILEKIV